MLETASAYFKHTMNPLFMAIDLNKCFFYQFLYRTRKISKISILIDTPL